MYARGLMELRRDAEGLRFAVSALKSLRPYTATQRAKTLIRKGMMMSYQVSKAIEKFWFWLAWRMPKPLVYFCTIRLGAHATQGVYGHTIVPDLTFMDALKRWESRDTKE